MGRLGSSIGGFAAYFLPAWAVLLGTAVLVAVVDVVIWPNLLSGTQHFLRPWWLSPSQWLGNLSLTETWRCHILGDPNKCVYLGHYWTLCCEEQFYAIVGAAAFLTPKRFFETLAAVTVVATGVGIAGALNGWSINGFFFDGMWLQFAIGIAVFFTLHYLPRQRLLVGWILTVIGLAIAVAFPSPMLEMHKNWQQQHVVALLFAGCLLFAHPIDGQLAQSRWLQPLMYCGVMCYSIYLVHMPICQLVAAILHSTVTPAVALSPWISLPFCFLTALTAAWLFHVAVERRFMNAAGPKATAETGMSASASIAG